VEVLQKYFDAGPYGLVQSSCVKIAATKMDCKLIVSAQFVLSLVAVYRPCLSSLGHFKKNLFALNSIMDAAYIF